MGKRHPSSKARQSSDDQVKLTNNGYRRYSRPLVVSLIGITLVAGLAVVCCLMLPNQKAHEDRLRVELARHVAGADYDAAMESLQELQRILPGSSQLALQRALIEQARGHVDVSAEIIHELIEQRNPEAALWELERIVNRSATQLDEQEQTRFEELVAIASVASHAKTRLRARQLWATNCLQLGDLNEALVTLEDVGKEDPASSLHAASIARQLGLTDRSRNLAANANRFFKSKLERHPADDQCRLSLARSLLLLDQESEALRLLSEGFELTRQPKFQQAAGEVMIAWSNRLKAGSSDSSSTFARLRLVHRATQCAPSDQAVLSCVAGLIVEFGQRSDQIKSSLREYITRGQDPESGHFMLGLLSLIENDTNEAKLHFDLAEKAGSHIATVLNNLALSAQTDKRLSTDQALLLVGEAIRRMPAEARFRETQSHFLVLKERHEAVLASDNQVGQ